MTSRYHMVARIGRRDVTRVRRRDSRNPRTAAGMARPPFESTSSRQWSKERDYFAMRARVSRRSTAGQSNVFSSVSERAHESSELSDKKPGNACAGIPVALGRVLSLSLDRKRDSNWRLSPNSAFSDPGHALVKVKSPRRTFAANVLPDFALDQQTPPSLRVDIWKSKSSLLFRLFVYW